LFLLVTLKDTIYLYFFIMATSMLAVLLAYTGYLGVYLLPSLYPYTTVLLPVFISIMYIFIILFSDTFLELKTRFPIFHWANIGFLVFWALLLLLVPFISYLNIARLMTPAQLVTIGITWLIGMTVFRSSTRPLRFFMLAWIGMAASLFLLVLVRLTIIPSNYFNENIFQLGFIVMAVSWSMALADRINLFKLQTDTANRNLKSSEHKLIQILEGIPLGVVVYGKDQKPTYMNQRSSEILSNPKTGKAPDLSAGRTITQAIEHFSFKAAGTGKTYPLEDIPVYQALQGKPAFVNDIEMDTGDARVPLEIWANPIMDEQGGVESAVAVFQDITEQRQLDVELAEYRRNLELLVKERTAELDEANEQLQLWVEWLLVANQVHQAIAGEADLPQAFEKLAATILHLLGAIFVLIVRWDAQDEHYQIFCKSTFEQATGVEEIRPIFSRETPLRNQIDEGKIIPLSPEQAASLPAPLGICFQDSSVQSLVFVPLKVRQAPAGVLGIASIAANIQMGTLQMELLERIAFDLSSLVEDASMLDQKRTLVAMEERNRLARDLHDSVTQTLFTTTLLSEVMPQVWRRDPEQGLQMLEKLRRLTRGALAEMRTMLIELRPSAVLNTPLSELLLQLTEAITSRSGVPFQLFIEKIDILPDDVQMNFYRIAQEAFNNVIKHSQAMHVTASLSEVPVNDVAGSEAKQIRLVIQDDGVGFASGNETPGRLGMGIMRERAAAIQADLSIISEPGHGTQVTLAWIGKLEVRTQV
jgi:signal transduction histidine kinase/PAS domain-containing protein